MIKQYLFSLLFLVSILPMGSLLWASSKGHVNSHQPSAIFLVVNNKTNHEIVCGQQAKMTRGRGFFMGNAAKIPPGQHSDGGFDGIFVTADPSDQAVGSFHCAIVGTGDNIPEADIELFFQYALKKATMGNLLTSIELRGFAQVSDPYKVTVNKSHAFRAHIDPPHLIYTIQ